MKEKICTYKDGDIVSYEEVTQAGITIITTKEYEKKKKKPLEEHQNFLNENEWRKFIKWKIKSIEEYAIKKGKSKKYIIHHITTYFNTDSSILHIQDNLDALFKYNPALNDFKYNKFTQKNEFEGKRYDEDKQPSEIFNFFKREFCEWCPRQDIKETIQETLNHNVYHPIIDYFNNIVWDGIERLETFLIDYYGAEDTPLNRVYFKRWMIALVKRILIPGSKFDSMLILAGEQGKKKTTLFNWLGTINGVTYYSEAPDNLKDINSLVYASIGKMILTFDDFDDICNKGELGKVKSFITVQDRVAALKWQHDKQYPITYVLAATTNQYNILVDDATFDERRFWVVQVNPKTNVFDIPDEIKDQLYAEAYYLYNQDTEQRLWIWEKELIQEEKELQKKYKKASEDPIIEKVIRIFINKYYLPNKKFLNENQFINAINGKEYEEYSGSSMIKNENDYHYISIIPISWVNNILPEKRSTDRIIQILHTQGFDVKKLSRYRYDGKIQLTCLEILNQPDFLD